MWSQSTNANVTDRQTDGCILADRQTDDMRSQDRVARYPCSRNFCKTRKTYAVRLELLPRPICPPNTFSFMVWLKVQCCRLVSECIYTCQLKRKGNFLALVVLQKIIIVSSYLNNILNFLNCRHDGIGLLWKKFELKLHFMRNTDSKLNYMT